MEFFLRSRPIAVTGRSTVLNNRQDDDTNGKREPEFGDKNRLAEVDVHEWNISQENAQLVLTKKCMNNNHQKSMLRKAYRETDLLRKALKRERDRFDAALRKLEAAITRRDKVHISEISSYKDNIDSLSRDHSLAMHV